MGNIDELKLDVNKKMEANFRDLKELLNNRSSKRKVWFIQGIIMVVVLLVFTSDLNI